MLVMSGGSEFQMLSAATLKATTNLVRGMMKSFLSAEQRFQVGTYSVIIF